MVKELVQVGQNFPVSGDGHKDVSCKVRIPMMYDTNPGLWESHGSSHLFGPVISLGDGEIVCLVQQTVDYDYMNIVDIVLWLWEDERPLAGS